MLKRLIAIITMAVLLIGLCGCRAEKTDDELEIQSGQGLSAESKPLPEGKAIQAVPTRAKKALIMGAEYQQGEYDPQNFQAVQNYMTKAILTFLADGSKENAVFSPLNIYLALGMLAEIEQGQARQELLTLLGAKDLAELRSICEDLWNAHYFEEEFATGLLASSVWLNDKVNYREEPVQILADQYHASSFQGKMGESSYQKALQEWLNAQTGGLLKDQTENVSMDPQTVVLLATTIYFNAQWTDNFSEYSTTDQPFYGTKGEQQASFMKKNETKTYYEGEHFGAVTQGLRGGNLMYFILPDEDASVEQVLQSEDFNLLMQKGYSYEQARSAQIRFSVPKFDINSTLNLKQGIVAMGAPSAMDPKVADFTPLTDEPIKTIDASHAARMLIDEKGCLAAAYTVIEACGTSMPPEEIIEFTLDRPFIVLLMRENGVPMFAGVVNHF